MRCNATSACIYGTCVCVFVCMRSTLAAASPPFVRELPCIACMQAYVYFIIACVWAFMTCVFAKLKLY